MVPLIGLTVSPLLGVGFGDVMDGGVAPDDGVQIGLQPGSAGGSPDRKNDVGLSICRVAGYRVV